MFLNSNAQLAVAVAIIFFVCPAKSQTDVAPLRFGDALRLLLNQHPALAAKRAELSAAQKGIDVAKRQFWPTPSISVDSGPENTQGKSKAFTASLSVPLYTGGQLTADLDVAQLREQLARNEIERTAHELALQLAASYRSWWFHSSRIELIGESYDRMTAINSMMKNRSQAGISAKLDVQQATVQSDRLRDDLLLAYRQRDDALAEISVLVGTPVNLQFESADDLFGPHLPDLQSLVDQAIRFDPKLSSAMLSLGVANAEIRKFKAGTLPTVTLRANKQYGTYLGALEAGARIFINSQLSLGAGLASLPMIDQASARAQTAQELVYVSERDLRTQMSSLWHEQQQAVAQRQSVLNQIETQTSLVDAGLRLFRAGRRSWQDLLSLFREHHQLQLQLNEINSSYLSSRLRLQLVADALPGFSFSSF